MGVAASVSLAAALALAGCGGRALQVVSGRVSVYVPGSVTGWSACLRRFGGLASGQVGAVVERVSARDRSLTFRVRSRVFGCDGLGSGRWCASSVGVLRAGRVVDGRLTLACRSRGRPVAFAWIDPVPTARRLLVESGGLDEEYRPAGRLPVRVAGGDVADDSASFRVVQYAAGGRELDRRTVVLRVAG